MKEQLSIDLIKELLDKYGYYADDELIYSTFLGLYQFSKGEVNHGQDIFATCLEGPPGAGKTFYAETYTKLTKELYGECELVEYQCDATTGKENLFEDINIVAAIKHDPDKVIIAGKLVDAINKLNEGKKVILFIDEYDKAREETDAFLLQFLQSGKINTNQFGDLEILPEYKNNLQVILCKNDFRENVSGPLSRRIRILRLDYMKPSVFNKLARKILIDNKEDEEKVDEGILNLVSLMYEEAYNNKEHYTKIPSASELLIAIQDADVLVKYANAPKSIIYDNIVREMFKTEDDIKTFEGEVISNNNLKEVISNMKNEDNKDDEEQEELNDLIMQSYFPVKINELNTYMDELSEMLDEIESIPGFRTISTEDDSNDEQINLSNNKYVKTDSDINPVSNFNDSTEFIRRGKHIFTASTEEWTEIANVVVPSSSAILYFSSLLNDAYSRKVVAYEDGFQIYNEEDGNIVMIREDDKDNSIVSLFVDRKVITASNLGKVLKILLEVSNKLPITNDDYKAEVSTLVHSNNTISDSTVDGYDNLYSVNLSFTDVNELSTYTNSIVNNIDKTDALEINRISKEIDTKAKARVKTR